MRYRYLDNFRRGISVFAIFSYGITVLGTPQCPPLIAEKGDTMRPSLLGSRFYCVTVAMETKWGQDNDKIAFGKFCTDWTGIVDIYLE